MKKRTSEQEERVNKMVTETINSVIRIMRKHKITRVRLAKELCTCQGTISKALNGASKAGANPMLKYLCLILIGINNISGKQYTLADLVLDEKPKCKKCKTIQFLKPELAKLDN